MKQLSTMPIILGQKNKVVYLQAIVNIRIHERVLTICFLLNE